MILWRPRVAGIIAKNVALRAGGLMLLALRVPERWRYLEDGGVDAICKGVFQLYLPNINARGCKESLHFKGVNQIYVQSGQN
jgi:hypothetical protein